LNPLRLSRGICSNSGTIGKPKYSPCSFCIRDS
jgi:hypothetical protein